MIISYAMFETSESFEAWQVDNAKVKILNIQPIITGLEMKMDGEVQKANADATTRVNVFVTYGNGG